MKKALSFLFIFFGFSIPGHPQITIGSTVLNYLKKLLFFLIITLHLLLLGVVDTDAQTWQWARGSYIHDTTVYGGGAHVSRSATDSYGNIYQAVTFQGDSVTFGSYTVSGGPFGLYYGALVKYDSTGNVIWAKKIAQIGQINHINIDNANNIYLTGIFTTPTLTLSTGTLSRVGLYYNYVLIKCNSSGNIIWAKNNGATWDGMDVKTDAQCNVYLGGDFAGTIYYGADSFVHAGTISENDVLILKYDSSGNYLWGKQAGAVFRARAMSLCLDNKKNIYISGYNYGPFTFAGDTLSSGPFDVNFLLKYDSSGTPQWG